MTTYLPGELADVLRDGLLSFPVTPFRETTLEVNEDAYRRHLAWQASHDVAGLFAAGGTGEGFSLTPVEIDRVVTTAVQEVGGTVPVLAPAAGNNAQAVAAARSAEVAGAAGLLLLPPYLTECDQQGLAAHVESVCRATRLGVIAYNRANARYDAPTLAALAERNPNLIGFKDGVGDLEHLTKVVTTLGDRLFYLGGLPTAETYALPLLQLGMSTYSSAMFNFVPDFALRFYRAVRAQDTTAVHDMLRQFVLPYIEIRDRRRGYGVSIIKAGLRVVGRDAGPVRPPLQDLAEQDVADLARLVGAVHVQAA